MKNIKKIIVLPIVALFLPYAASAASVNLTQLPQEIGAGDTVAVLLLVDSALPLNAFSGSLRYPKETLEFIGLNDGNSIISLWLSKPVDTRGGISFSGMVPGGFAGDNGLLFTAFFRAKAAGSATLSLADAVFLRNDGTGSADPVASSSLSIVIGGQARGGFVENTDTDPPEPFYIQLGKNPDLFGGRSYAAFTTTDKGSGVGYYEVAERRVPFMPLRWQRAESPFALGDQYLTSDVFVRAVDNAGNERVAALARSRMLRAYEVLILGILLAVLCIYIYGKRSA